MEALLWAEDCPMLPFTPQQFLALFVDYNEAIWPMQLGGYVLGGVAIALLFWQPLNADRLISGAIAVMWLWTGVVYHGVYFATINNAAYLFAAMFMAQGVYLIYSGVLHHQVQFGFRTGLLTWTGAALVVYAAILYPLIGIMTGHAYAEIPVFGVTPCPVTIFTLGMLLLTTNAIPRSLLVIPFIWSLIGGSAAILLYVPQDWPLLVSGIIVFAVVIAQNRARQIA